MAPPAPSLPPSPASRFTGLFTIPSTVSFVDGLAAGLLDWAGDDPLALAQMTVLLPTRRAGRSLREAFLRLTDGRATLLPRMLPLGDLDAEDDALIADGGGAAPVLAPVLAPTRRLLMLATLVRRAAHAQGEPIPAHQAVDLARDLALLIDDVQREETGFDRLADLVPDRYARHWQKTLDFLTLATRHWPDIVAAEGALEPVARRVALLNAQAARWQADPPRHPVIAAGSTGSVPAAARLMRTILDLPQGAVVLPGLDLDMPDGEWDVQRLPPTHPQIGLALLLETLGRRRMEVAAWPTGRLTVTPAPADRAQLLSRANAETPGSLDRIDGAAALSSVVRLDAKTQAEEATAIALLMREVLETPGKRAALVTPDRVLARRVIAELRRYEIEVDDSAGTPLAHTPQAVFFRLCLTVLEQEVAPAILLSIAKHPLLAMGEALGVARDRARALERVALRGPRPAAGFDGLLRHLAALADDLRTDQDLLGPATTLIRALQNRFAPLETLLRQGPADPSALLDAHIALAEALASVPSDDDKTDVHETGAQRLWSGTAGSQLAEALADAREHLGLLGPLDILDYGPVLDTLLSGRMVRETVGRHPRLYIWGPLEARLQQADRMILSGLNEGTWPALPEEDPWLSRPMRQTLGLPAPERRIGLSAHDFAQGFGAAEVFLTRAEKVDGTPTVPARWLQRLAVVEGLLRDHQPAAGACLDGTAATARLWLQRAALLDQAANGDKLSIMRPVTRPNPRPPVAARPRRLSATQIETLQKDPYSIYARHILKLVPLDPLDADADAAIRGQIIHAVMERFVKRYPAGLPPDPLADLLAMGRDVFATLGHLPGIYSFWWPRFERAARWVVAQEVARRPALQEIYAERRGQYSFTPPDGAGPFTLTARADRIELRRDGGLTLLDYKTGTPPRPSAIYDGSAPQLLLEGVIARAGGFDGVRAGPVHALEIWQLKGGSTAGTAVTVDDDLAPAIANAAEKLAELIAAFDRPDTPYLAEPDPTNRQRYNDYRHLARSAEWGGEGTDDQ